MSALPLHPQWQSRRTYPDNTVARTGFPSIWATVLERKKWSHVLHCHVEGPSLSSEGHITAKIKTWPPNSFALVLRKLAYERRILVEERQQLVSLLRRYYKHGSFDAELLQVGEIGFLV
jgi:hypothetical protein